MSGGALSRVIRRAGDLRAEAAERCELCGETLDARHRHLVDTDRAELLCACRPCSLLFVRDAAGGGHYLLVPRRRRRLGPVPTEALGVPVGLAFFVPGPDGGAIAHYPSPAGATRWQVDAPVWRELCSRHPELAGMAPQVEALLVNTAREREQHWIVPVDDAFRIVALVRREWRGLSGGGRVWPAVDGFFAELTEQD